MESQQPLINNPNNANYPQNNQFQNPQIVNPAPYYPNNNNYYQQSNQNNLPQNNSVPQEVLQYPNSSDFPNYNPVTNENQTQIDYSKYTNINQLNHRGIKQSNIVFFGIEQTLE